MKEPDTSRRWDSPSAPTLALRLCAGLLGVTALTGCAWAVLAGHAWLGLLAGGARWLATAGPHQAVARAVQQPALTASAAAAVTATAVAAAPPALAPPPTAPPVAAPPAAERDALPPSARPAGAPAALPEQKPWPEPLEYEGAACAGVFVYAVTLSERAPRWSAVSLATSSAGRAKYARPGQRVEDWEVLGITDDWTGANPLVWLAREKEVCHASLTGNPARVKAVQLEAARREAQLRQEAKRKRDERRRRRRRARRRR